MYDIFYNIEPDVPKNIYTDISRLRQILVNLIGNSLKFSQHGEFVDIRVRWLKNMNELEFRIKDKGIGISNDKIQQIFSVFTQADSSISKIYGGTGLGLTISSLLIKMLGGRIWVESEIGKGSSFYFTIKIQSINQSDEPEKQILNGMTIYLLDDLQIRRNVIFRDYGILGAHIK